MRRNPDWFGYNQKLANMIDIRLEKYIAINRAKPYSEVKRPIENDPAQQLRRVICEDYIDIDPRLRNLKI